jgi:cytochrome c oxidase subunit 3
MPATIHPIDSERRARRVDDLDHGDHGNGRRPPTDKRTGGGGDNDNGSDRPRGARAAGRSSSDIAWGSSSPWPAT